MRERLHAVAGKQTLIDQDDELAVPRVGKRTLTEQLGAGEALPHELQRKFGASLGRDLSHVRVHTGPAAETLAGKLSARAFTLGGNIVFGANQYRPETDLGRSLIAHEVAHAAQQADAAIEPVTGPTELARASEAAEANADGAAAAMVAGWKAMVMPQPAAIARKGLDESIDTGASTEGASHDETIGELTAERVGEEPDASMGGELVGKPETQSVRQGLAGAGGAIQGDVQAAPPDAAPPPPAGGEGGEAGASVEEAQHEIQQTAAAIEGETAAYKAEMKAKQDQFDAEQHATVLAQLKTMSAKDKRSTLADLGYDPNAIKKLKDSELDDVISGKLEAENRRGKILGMEPEELAKLSSQQKLQFLCDLGIDRKDLDKAGTAKCDKLFADIIQAAKVPGQKKIKIQIKGGLFGKSWNVTVKVDDAGVDISAKKEGGFLSKLGGWIKAALPVILTVLGPITGGVSLIALSIYQTVVAIKTGNWLGAIVGAAGAFAGLGVLGAVKNAAGGFAGALQKVAGVAAKVQKAADVAEKALAAAKAKNAGSLLAVLAGGASTFAKFASAATSKFATTMNAWSERLRKWSQIATGAQKVVAGIKDGDVLAAVGGAFETAGAVAGGKTGKDLARASTITTYVNSGRKALQANPPNYAAVADAALGIAGQLHADRRIDDAQRIVQRANALRVAWNNRNADPTALAKAAMGLAEAVATAKYDLEHDEKKDADGKPVEDKERDAMVARYQRNTRIVTSAASALRAVTTRPPNYTAALAAFAQLSAELTEDKRVDAAAVLAAKMDRWTQAVRSGDERAILEAGIAFGEAINGMRSSIEGERDRAKQEAEKALPPGEKLPTGDGIDKLPPGPNRADLLNGVPDLPADPTKPPIEIDPPEREHLTFSQDVQIAQQMLNRLGNSLATDGLLGESTRHALAAFQRTAHLPATGQLDGTTLDRLIAATSDSTVNAAEQDAHAHDEVARLKSELARAQLDARLLIVDVHDSLPRLRNHHGGVAGYFGDQLDLHLPYLQAALDSSLTTTQYDAATTELRHQHTVVERDLEGLKRAVEPYAVEGEILAGGAKGIVWLADTTFKAFADKNPALAAAYGFLSRALPVAIHEGDLRKALIEGASGAVGMWLDSKKIDKSKLFDVIAKETAKALADNAPELIEKIGAIRASSFSDFCRQAEPIVATFCEKVATSIAAKVIVSLAGSLPGSSDIITWVNKVVQDALKKGVKGVLEDLYDALEKQLAT